MQNYQDETYQTKSPKLNTFAPHDGGHDRPQPNLGDKTDGIISSSLQSSYLASNYTEKDNQTVLSQIKQEIAYPERHAPPSKSVSLSRLQTSPVKTSPVRHALHEEISPGEFPLSGGSNSLSSPEGFASSSKSQSKRERARNHTPRPSNSFILYRREKHVELMAQYKGQKTLSNNVISKIVASMWRSETPEVKAHYSALAEQEKKAHLLKYPDYKYRPRKSGTSKKSPTSVSKKSPPVREKPIREEIPIIHHGHYQPMQWNVGPPLGHYQPIAIHPMDSHRASLMDPTEVERGFELMNNERFGNAFETEFLPQDGILAPEYGNAWPAMHGVWGMGLDHNLEGRPH